MRKEKMEKRLEREDDSEVGGANKKQKTEETGIRPEGSPAERERKRMRDFRETDRTNWTQLFEWTEEVEGWKSDVDKRLSEIKTEVKNTGANVSRMWRGMKDMRMSIEERLDEGFKDDGGQVGGNGNKIGEGKENGEKEGNGGVEEKEGETVKV